MKILTELFLRKGARIPWSNLINTVEFEGFLEDKFDAHQIPGTQLKIIGFKATGLE